MRPRKLVLIFDDDEERRRVLRFVVQVRGYGSALYRVRSAAAWPKRPRWELAAAEVAIVRMSGEASSKVCCQVRDHLPGIRVLLISEASCMNGVALDAWLPQKASMEEILATLRTLALRRRGPKRKPAAAVTIREWEAVWEREVPGGIIRAAAVSRLPASRAAG